MIKLIASDLDGTLLRNGAQEVDPKVYDLIRTLKEKGVHFAAASGRQLYSLRRLFEPVKDEISYIAENGSLCISGDQVIAKGLISRDLSLRIFEAAREYGSCHILLSCESACYTDSQDPVFNHHMRDVVHYDIKTVNRLEEVNEPFLKIALCDFDGTKKLLPYFQERFGDEIKVVTSGNLWVDFIAPGANKGTALQALASHLGITPEECVAFGDQYNDTEMLQFAGTSYAMSTAAPGIAYYATYVTNSVEEVLEDIADTL
jgi:cof-like hydrolase